MKNMISKKIILFILLSPIFLNGNEVADYKAEYLFETGDFSVTGIRELITDKDNGFTTFSISNNGLERIIHDVYMCDLDRPPTNRLRKVIFKMGSGLDKFEKLSIVGKLIGRGKKIVEDDIYECMLSLNNEKQKITINKIAKSLSCSSRTIYRNMGNQLKLEKELLNSEL